MRPCALALILCLTAVCAEKAAYDSNGRITALLSDGGALGLTSSLVAVLPSGKRVPLQVPHEGSGIARDGHALAWTLTFTLPDGSRGRAVFKSEEDAAGLRYSTTLTADTDLEVAAIEFVLDLPHTPF